MADLWKNNPFDELKRIQDRIDSKYGDQFAATGTSIDILQQDSDITVTVDLPRVSFRRQGDDIIMTADMPGVEEDDIYIDIQDDRILEFSVQRKEEMASEEKAGVLCLQRKYMFYCRSIMLPAPVDRKTAKVSYNNGTLEIKIPVIPGTSPGGIPAG